METDKQTNPQTPPKVEQKKGLGRGLAALLGGESFGSLNKKTVIEEAPVVVPQAAVVEHNLPENKIETREEPATESVKDTAVTQEVVAVAIQPKEDEYKEYRIRKISIDEIHANNEQPRQHFEDAKLQELAESICEQGLIQPIIVRMMGPQNYQIVAGERRWRACKMLGMTEIPAILREEDEQPEKAELASVIENIQRVELNPVELAEAYSKIIKNYDFTQEALAKKLGVSRVSIANTLRLQKLPAGVKDALIQGKITEGHARALLTLEKDEDISALAQETIALALNVREVEARVRLKIQGPAPIISAATKENGGLNNVQVKEAAPKSPETLATEEELRGIFGTKVLLKGNTRGGTIEIYYSNEDSLHRLLHQLRSAANK